MVEILVEAILEQCRFQPQEALTSHLKKCWQVFDNNIPHANCKPHSLFYLKYLSKNGYTTEWGQIKRYCHLISDILNLTDGMPPHLASLTQVLRCWIDWYSRSHGIPQFTINEVEKAAYFLSRMIASLGKLKRGRRKMLHGWESLQVLLDKVRVTYHWDHADWDSEYFGSNLGNWSRRENFADCNPCEVVTANAAERSKFLQS